MLIPNLPIIINYCVAKFTLSTGRRSTNPQGMQSAASQIQQTSRLRIRMKLDHDARHIIRNIISRQEKHRV